MAFDRRAGRLVALAGSGSAVETWTFDVCENTWTQMHPNRGPSSPSMFGTLVYDADSDMTIAFDDSTRRVWAYDFEADTWTEKGSAPAADPRFALRFYDPVSGLVVALGDDGDDDTLGLALWGYEVETDTWTPIRQANRLAIGPLHEEFAYHHEEFAYDASVDRLVAYSKAWEPAEDGARLFETRTWPFDLRTGTWSGTGAVTPEFFYGYWARGSAIAYDEAAERTVMSCQGLSAAYDATADRWETVFGGSTSEDPLAACATHPECREAPHMVYDPVNGRLVVYGGHVNGGVNPDDVLAFDTRTREWTVLLEASKG